MPALAGGVGGAALLAAILVVTTVRPAVRDETIVPTVGAAGRAA